METRQSELFDYELPVTDSGKSHKPFITIRKKVAVGALLVAATAGAVIGSKFEAYKANQDAISAQVHHTNQLIKEQFTGFNGGIIVHASSLNHLTATIDELNETFTFNVLNTGALVALSANIKKTFSTSLGNLSTSVGKTVVNSCNINLGQAEDTSQLNNQMAFLVGLKPIPSNLVCKPS